MSIEELDNIIPVNPPIINNIIKPKDRKTEIFNFNFADFDDGTSGQSQNGL